MNHKKLLVITFPSIIIFMLCMIIFLNFLDYGLFTFDQALFICLGIIVPIMFLMQGVICGITNTNVYISFLLSMVSSSYIVTIYTDLSIRFMIYAGTINSVQGYLAYLLTIAVKKKLTLRCINKKKQEL